MVKRQLRLPNSANLALFRLLQIQEETRQRNEQRKQKSALVKRVVTRAQRKIKSQNRFIRQADKVIRYQGTAQTLNELAEFNNQPESEVVLLGKYNKFVSRLTIQGNLQKNPYYAQFFEGDSGDAVFFADGHPAQVKKILVFRPTVVQAVNVQQIFRESAQNNCVFVPIRKTITDILAQDMTRNTRKKYEHILDLLQQEEANYPNGVPQDDIPDLAKRLQIRMEITDLIGQKFIEEGSKNCKANVKLTNTRNNHVDQITSNEEIEVEQKDMSKIYDYLRENNLFYVIYNNTTDIKKIMTLSGTYVTKNPDKDLIAEMSLQIRSSSIDALKHERLNQFLKKGRVINSAPVLFQPITSNVKCYDMRNAYAQFTEAPFYEGFPYLLHQFRNVTTLHTIGIYEFEALTETDLSVLLGIRKNHKYILPSPEIKWWQQFIETRIIAGAFGSSTDLHMSPQFVKKKLYNKWIGKLSMSDNYRFSKHTVPADEDFANHITSKYPDSFYYRHKKEMVVRIPHTKVSTNHHIAAFFTSYTRLNMLNELQHIPTDDIYGLELDAIFTTTKITNPLFREKPMKIMENLYTTDRWYDSTFKTYVAPTPHTLITESSVLAGQGGSGKTYSILNDPGYLDVLYVVPSTELGERSNHKFATIHRLLGLNCEPIHATYIPKVILIDEITQIHEDLIKQAFEKYPHSLILLAGDIDNRQHYQCRGGFTNNYMPIYKPTIPIVHFTTDYRSHTQELKDMKLELRKVMKSAYTDGGIDDTRIIRNYITSTYPTITLKKAKELYTDQDIFMWSTHKTQSNLKDFKNAGVHAFQGQTIDPPTKVFITLDWFEYAMPYTALSRVRDHRQIYFVRSD